MQPPPQLIQSQEGRSGTPSAAPVFLIRDVASEVGVRRQNHVGLAQGPDIVSRGLVSVQDAGALIELCAFLPSILILVFKD